MIVRARGGGSLLLGLLLCGGAACGGAGGGGGGGTATPGSPAPAAGPAQCTHGTGAKPQTDDAQQLLPWPQKAIADLDGAKSPPGGYNVEGYVWDVYVPQNCPAGEMCTDEPPHVIVNEKSSDEWVTNPRQLAVIVRDPAKLKSGVRYKMSIALCGTKEMGASINVGEMRAYVESVK